MRFLPLLVAFLFAECAFAGGTPNARKAVKDLPEIGIPPFRFVDKYAERNGKTEALSNIAKAFPRWFHPKFGEFVDNVDRLPVDQHMLAALVAPRALMNTE